MKKLLTFALSAVLSLGTLCACGNEGEDVPMEELEYGATMRQLNDTDIDICYDGRFFTDEEMRVVADYYYAIQTKDKELFLSTQSDLYIKYIEKNVGNTADDYINNIYTTTAAAIGEGFEYTYIEAVAYGDKTDDLEIDEIISLMDSIYEENGKDTTFKETVTSSKYAVLDFMAESNGEGYTYTDQVVYIFTCTDGVYIFTL